jgi:DNA-binding GntR family transcriptional regulator
MSVHGDLDGGWGADGADPDSAGAREPLVEGIVRDLREEILAGSLEPGSRLSQPVIAEKYGVSRLPVREALRSLESQGLVTIDGARGARVTKLSNADLQEICIMREQLEPLVLRTVIQHISEAELDEAEDILRTMESLEIEAPDWLRLDRRFHTMWYDAVGMPRLTRTLTQLWDGAERYRRVFTSAPRAKSISEAEHWLILEAMRRRAAPDAEALVQIHLRHLWADVAPAIGGHRRGRP